MHTLDSPDDSQASFALFYKAMANNTLNRLLLALAAGIWLLFVLLKFTPFADAIIAAVSIGLGFFVFLFPSFRGLTTHRWFDSTLTTVALTVLCTLGAVLNFTFPGSNTQSIAAPQPTEAVAIAAATTASIPPASEPTEEPEPQTATATDITVTATSAPPTETRAPTPTATSEEPTAIPATLTPSPEPTTPAPTPSPTSSNTPAETVLGKGDTWTYEGMKLTLLDVRFDTDIMYIDWMLTNNATNDISINWVGDLFTAESNLGESVENKGFHETRDGWGYGCSKKEFILRSGTSVKNPCNDFPLAFKFDTSNSQITSITITAFNIGRIEKSNWQVDVPLH